MPWRPSFLIAAGLGLVILFLVLVFGGRQSPLPGDLQPAATAPPPKIQALAVGQSARRSPRGRAAHTARKKPPPAGELEPQAEPELKLPGKSQFQRRLAAGGRLRELSRALRADGSNLEAVAAETWKLRPALLKADGQPLIDILKTPPEKVSTRSLQFLLGLLTRPPRDLHSLKLANRIHGDDPLGNDLLVRLWTRGGSYPAEEIAAAERLLRHLFQIAGFSLEEGFDVLATPRKGEDVFPHQGGYSWAAGLYFPGDGYCTVQSTLAPPFRSEVLRHELIHKLCDRLLEDYFSSRLIVEGLPEYLRLLRPGNGRLRVPNRRLADDFALLISQIDRLRGKSVPMDDFDPRKLLSLPAKKFYALRSFSYLMAQAAMAYIGPAAIEEAFRCRSSRPIADAVQRIQWPDFLEFIRDNAREGFPERAIVVEDPHPLEALLQEEPAEAKELIRSALRDLGATVAENIDLDPRLFSASEERINADEAVREALLTLLQAAADGAGGEAPPLLFLDPDCAADSLFSLAENPRLFRAPLSKKTLEGWDRKSFTEALGRLIGHGGGQEALLLPSPERLSEATQDQKDLPLEAIFCVAGTDEAARREIRSRWSSRLLSEEEMRRELSRFYAAAFERSWLFVRTALVVDLGEGKSDALPLAEGIAASQGFKAAVAFWDPQKPVAAKEGSPPRE
ncbi:MAG: hypothetical protein HY717_19150 [Planctomycetes bacterium]|nr:hypothetical protein [Planctomycetota bacterium]